MDKEKSEEQVLRSEGGDDVERNCNCKNTEAPTKDKEHYCFAIGDLKMVYEIALEKAAQSAAQEGLVDIARAAQSLIEYLQEKKNC